MQKILFSSDQFPEHLDDRARMSAWRGLVFRPLLPQPLRRRADGIPRITVKAEGAPRPWC